MAVLGITNLKPLYQIFLQTSQTWTADRTGTLKCVAIGAGGGGGCSSNSGFSGGGGAGGYSEQIIAVTLGDTFTATVGAAGAQKTLANFGVSSGKLNGADGGDSRFVTASGATIDINAGGGGGGVANRAVAVGSSVAGGAGGSASGGTSNRVGGAGGSACSMGGGSGDGGSAGGGGAVAIRSAVGYRGGNCTGITSLAERSCAGGGAGIGGNGGDSTTTNTNQCGSGGGSGAPGVTNAGASENQIRPQNGGIMSNYLDPELNHTVGAQVGLAGNIAYQGFGSDTAGSASQSADAPEDIFNVFGTGGCASQAGNEVVLEKGGPGGGGGGIANTQTGNQQSRPTGGVFGGGGGKASTSFGDKFQTGHGGPFGGGGGGAVSALGAGNQQVFSGPGASGVIILQWLSYSV